MSMVMTEQRLRSGALGMVLEGNFKHTEKNNDPFYSEENMELLKESKEQMENKRIIVRSWQELEAIANE